MLTKDEWRQWLGTPAATRTINALWPDPVTTCRTPECQEPATEGSRCASCEQFDRELAVIRQKEANEAQFTRYVRSEFQSEIGR